MFSQRSKTLQNIPLCMLFFAASNLPLPNIYYRNPCKRNDDKNISHVYIFLEICAFLIMKITLVLHHSSTWLERSILHRHWLELRRSEWRARCFQGACFENPISLKTNLDDRSNCQSRHETIRSQKGGCYLKKNHDWLKLLWSKNYLKLHFSFRGQKYEAEDEKASFELHLLRHFE